MSITVKKLIKPLVIIPILLITSFISIKPFQAYAEDDQPTTIEECREKKQEAKNIAGDSYADWVYKSCMQEIGQEPQPETPSQDTPTSSPIEHCRYFLGMVSWDCNVSLLNQDKNISQDDLGSSIWTIAANIATDITVIAAYLVVGYIIYGGYLYIFSAGDTNKTVTGKKAIHQALLGLAIVLSANIILNGIRIGLVGVKSGFTTSCVTGECIEPADMVKNALEWVIGISGAVSAIFIVYGGTSYTMSRGDANKVQTAKQIITYALIGMIIVTLAELIVIFASNIINSANNTAYLDTNQISIIKEYHET